MYSQSIAWYSQLAGPSWGNAFTPEEAALMLHNELAERTGGGGGGMIKKNHHLRRARAGNGSTAVWCPNPSIMETSAPKALCHCLSSWGSICWPLLLCLSEGPGTAVSHKCSWLRLSALLCWVLQRWLSSTPVLGKDSGSTSLLQLSCLWLSCVGCEAP